MSDLGAKVWQSWLSFGNYKGISANSVRPIKKLSDQVLNDMGELAGFFSGVQAKKCRSSVEIQF